VAHTARVWRRGGIVGENDCIPVHLSYIIDEIKSVAIEQNRIGLGIEPNFEGHVIFDILDLELPCVGGASK
jgi:hypothetical protein